MTRSLNLLTALVLVLVAAFPALADASTGLTDSKGVLVPVGTKLYGTNTTSIRAEATGVGTLGCERVVLALAVTKNNATEGVEAQSAGLTSTASTCFRNGSTAITVDNIVISSIKSSASESGTGRKTASYIAHIGSLNCKFQLTNVVGTYTSGGDVLTITKQPQTVTPAACGAGGTLSGSFTMETQASPASPVFLM